MGFLEVGDCSVKKLNKELCALALLKRGFHEYFLTDFVDKHPFPLNAKTTIRNVLANHEMVRKKLSSYPGDPPVELSWQSTQQASTVQLLELIEGIVYGDHYDATLRTGAALGPLMWLCAAARLFLVAWCLFALRTMDGMVPRFALSKLHLCWVSAAFGVLRSETHTSRHALCICALATF